MSKQNDMNEKIAGIVQQVLSKLREHGIAELIAQEHKTHAPDMDVMKFTYMFMGAVTHGMEFMASGLIGQLAVLTQTARQQHSNLLRLRDKYQHTPTVLDDLQELLAHSTELARKDMAAFREASVAVAAHHGISEAVLTGATTIEQMLPEEFAMIGERMVHDSPLANLVQNAINIDPQKYYAGLGKAKVERMQQQFAERLALAQRFVDTGDQTFYDKSSEE